MNNILNNGVCPHCGYCPTCGRGGSISPYPQPYYYPFQYYTTNAIGLSGQSSTLSTQCNHGGGENK